jgi:hypothetical protein
MGRFGVVAVTSGEVPLPGEAEMAEIQRLAATHPWGPSAPARVRPKIDEGAAAIAAKAAKQLAHTSRQWGSV